LRAKGRVYFFSKSKITKEERINMKTISLPGFTKTLDLKISNIKRIKEITLAQHNYENRQRKINFEKYCYLR